MVRAGFGALDKATIHDERKSNGVMPARNLPLTKRRWKLWWKLRNLNQPCSD